MKFLKVAPLALLLAVPSFARSVDDDEDEAPAPAPRGGVERVAGPELADAFDASRALLRNWLAGSEKKASRGRSRSRSRRRSREDSEDNGNGNGGAAIPGAKAAASKLSEILEQARDRKTPETGRAFKAAYLAYAEAGLKGLRLAASDDASEARKGRKMAELASDDLEGLAASLGDSSAAGGGGPGNGNLGFDLSAGGYTNYTTFQVGASYGRPLGQLMEAGGGVHLGLEMSGAGDYASTTFNIGVDLYGRANFYGAFKTPLAVPFLGAHLGLNGSLGSQGTSATTGGTFVIGPQAGILFYANRNVGINLMGQLDYSSSGSSTTSFSSSGGDSSTGSSGLQFLVSAGLRFML